MEIYITWYVFSAKDISFLYLHFQFFLVKIYLFSRYIRYISELPLKIYLHYFSISTRYIISRTFYIFSAKRYISLRKRYILTEDDFWQPFTRFSTVHPTVISSGVMRRAQQERALNEKPAREFRVMLPAKKDGTQSPLTFWTSLQENDF